MESCGSSNKRPRDADLAAVEAVSPEAEAKRLRPEDLLDILDDDSDAAAAGDLASVMRSFEEEIAAGEGGESGAAVAEAPQPELGFLLEASDDELGLPPAASSSEEAGAGDAQPAGFGQIWGFEDEIAGGFGEYGTTSPEAAAAAAAAAAAQWEDDRFEPGLFGFGDDAYGPSDLAAWRQGSMPAV